MCSASWSSESLNQMLCLTEKRAGPTVHPLGLPTPGRHASRNRIALGTARLKDCPAVGGRRRNAKPFGRTQCAIAPSMTMESAIGSNAPSHKVLRMSPNKSYMDSSRKQEDGSMDLVFRG
jgi:hypothetical protein